ncbi:MAG: cytochrome c [Sediminibacterium sp.]
MFKIKTAFISGLVTIIILAISGCYKTVTIVPNPGSSITTEMSFSKDIIPIFEKSCNASGCHSAGGKSPNLTAPLAFSSLTVGNYLKANDPDNSLLMLWLNGKKSPVMPVGAGPDAEINAKIYAWINQGAKNN